MRLEPVWRLWLTGNSLQLQKSRATISGYSVCDLRTLPNMLCGLLDLTFMWPCIVANFFVIKPTRCTNFTNLFWHETLHVSDSSTVYHQDFIHCTLSNGIWFVDSCRAGSWSCSTAVYKPVWHILLLSVQWINSWWWTDELSETCRVSWQNKFVKLLYLGFITKKYWI